MAAPFFLKECKSTNDEIIKLIPAQQHDFVALYTLNQTAGRGQYGNSWQMAQNLNLAFSIAVPSKYFNDYNHFVNFRTALLLRDFIAKMTAAQVEIKWPNDLIIRNKKIAGLLSEKIKVNSDEYYIIGIGLNVLQEEFPGLSKAGSLLTQTNKKLDPHKVANSLYDELNKSLRRDFAVSDLLKDLNLNLFRKDVISVFECNAARQNGIIREVDADGFLWVDLENDGLQKFFHKEIELLY